MVWSFVLLFVSVYSKFVLHCFHVSPQVQEKVPIVLTVLEYLQILGDVFLDDASSSAEHFGLGYINEILFHQHPDRVGNNRT